MRMIFVNLPVRDLEASRRFYGGLGFGFNPQFSTDDCLCVMVESNIVLMLLTERRFRDFITGEISDTAKGKEVLLCLSAGSRAEVKELKAKALASGGREWMADQDHGFMYGASFQDPDGHVLEAAWMDPAAVAQGAHPEAQPA
ncbi:lactoylglutathione lyase [Phenylobacterium zucineum HLK1]|uniref:Lactoylglutathione lyase n=1 Tax=Phenylobacterium zucineum (strain HLK1) TaxID=450851 RepID=B4RGU3_PHEZH|nr:VOC family protein [Phenylobacterium zucineum]ACG77309.1 lactoylglutathione lyase [Phenylobacterium zucineum HLK1]